MNSVLELERNILLWESAIAEKLPTAEFELCFRNYISQNKAFSIEDIYRIVKLHNHACSLKFVPTSEAYQIFGYTLTISEILFEDVDDEELVFKASLNKERHWGYIRAKTIENLSAEQRTFLETTGIDTSNIYEIESL